MVMVVMALLGEAFQGLDQRKAGGEQEEQGETSQGSRPSRSQAKF